MRLAGREIKIIRPIFKIEMLVYQSKGNLDEKILFHKITHHLDPEIRNMLVNSKFGTRIPHSIVADD